MVILIKAIVTALAFTAISTVVVTMFLVKGYLLEAILVTLGISAFWYIFISERKKSSRFSLEQFKSEHPEAIDRNGFIVCPHCAHNIHRAQLSLQSETGLAAGTNDPLILGKLAFRKTTFEIFCNKCEALLLIEHSKNFYSTLGLREAQKPQQHRLGRFEG